MTDAENAALEEIVAVMTAPKAPLTHRQIAARLGLSHGTVQNMERRALEKLRRLATKGAA